MRKCFCDGLWTEKESVEPCRANQGRHPEWAFISRNDSVSGYTRIWEVNHAAKSIRLPCHPGQSPAVHGVLSSACVLRRKREQRLADCRGQTREKRRCGCGFQARGASGPWNSGVRIPRKGRCHRVKVHTPDKRDGAVLPAKRASTACTIQASTFRFCLRHVSTTVSSRSTNRLPSADCVPNDNFRQITA